MLIYIFITTSTFIYYNWWKYCQQENEILDDKEIIKTTLGQESCTPMPYRDQNNILYKGSASVIDGRFSFSFLAASLPINLFLSSLTKRSNEHSNGP